MRKFYELCNFYVIISLICLPLYVNANNDKYLHHNNALMHNEEEITTIPFQGWAEVVTCGGIFTDHEPDGDYLDNADGTITIYPSEEGKMVKISFIYFDVEERYDNLLVYNGETTNGTPIAILSGHSLPSDIVAKNFKGALSLRFVTDGDTHFKGFKFEATCMESPVFATVPYSGHKTITTCDTLITHHDPSGNYQNLADGTLTILPAREGSNILLSFYQFETESSYDFLEIYEGTSIHDTMVARLSGFANSYSYATYGSNAAFTLRFTSDVDVTSRGFMIQASCLDGLMVPYSGHRTISSCDDIISSNIDPAGNYLNNSDGSLTILPSEEGKVVKLNFTEFETELTFDRLSVYNGEELSENLFLQRYSGSEMPGDIVAFGASGALTLHFSSDASINRKGFKVKTSCVDPLPNLNVVPFKGENQITTCDAVVTHHNPNGNYANFADGSLTIYPEIENSLVSINFESLSLENNYDFLYIYDGEDIYADLIMELSGEELPNEEIMASNSAGALTIRMTSDDSYTFEGFKFTSTCKSIVTDLRRDLNTTSKLLYPNPNNGKFYLKEFTHVGEMSIKIYDLSSQLVFEDKILNGHKINTDLLPGFYLINIHTSDGLMYQDKFIVE